MPIQSNITGGAITTEADPIYTADKPNIANLSGADFTGNISALNLSGTNTGDETNESIKTKLGTDLTDKALDSAVVHNTGNETVAGVKNFTDNQIGANISQLNMGTCTTAQATVLKEATLEGYVPKQGDTVKVLMTNASVANATIRFNGGTTYTIRNATSATSTSSWGANSICEFLLDGTYAFLVSIKTADSTTQPTFYGNASSASASTSSTYSTGGIISVNTLSDININTDKWAYFGYFTLTYNATYSSGMSINHCFLFTEYSRLNSDVSVNDLEAFQVQVKVNLAGVTSSSLFNSAVPNIAINITGKTNLTTNDFCALVYSTSTSAKVIRLYVKLKTPNKHYGFLPICYGNNAYSSTGAISTSYISWTSASVQALISDLPTPAQGAPVFAAIYPNYGSNTGDETGTTIKEKFATEERWFTHSIEITRNLVRIYDDINHTEIPIPSAEVFNLSSDNSNFAVLLPIPLGMTVGKQELKLYEDGIDISSSIYESNRPFMSGRNQCPISTDWVFAFRVDKIYNENATYILRITDKRIPIEPENFEGVPFSKELSDPVMYAPDADNILFPPLPYPYVYEVWRWIRNKGGEDPLANKKQYALSVMKYYKEAFGRFRLFCRGDFEERTLQEITSRLDTGIDSLRIGIKQGHPRLVPFKIAIFNTLTGARTVFSQCYGWVQTGMTKNDRGFRRILDK